MLMKLTAGDRITNLGKINLLKIVHGDLDLGLSRILLLTQLPKNDTRFKSGQKRLKNIHSSRYVTLNS